VFGDESINPDFKLWLMYHPTEYQIDASTFKFSDPWMATAPLQYSLTGRGDLHNSEQEYQFPFTIDGPRADEAFSSLTEGSGPVWTQMTVAGGDPEYKKAFADAFSYLSSYSTKTFGRKGFLIVARFTENTFNDDIAYAYGYSSGDTLVTCRDVYLPLVNFEKNPNKNPDHIDEGDTLTNVFSFTLDSVSLEDKGGFAKIVETGLYMAKKPAGMLWNDSTRALITIDSLISYSNNYYRVLVDKPDYEVQEIVFKDIDPRDWTSGDYIFAIYVRDEFGNEGLANTVERSDYNPFLVTVKSQL
jgi:hypothetical protein